MTGNSAPQSEFAFRKHDRIGSADAADDAAFLKDCFIDTGELEVLQDCDAAQTIIVGRTGAGKTALLTIINEQQPSSAQLSPHELSINYIANNTIIRFFEDAGLNLTPFYMLLWKHIFVVELLKMKYDIRTEDSQRYCMSRLRELLKKDAIKELAVDYLEKWGNKFWLTTEERMHELTDRIQNSLSAELSAGAFGASLDTKAAKDLTTEQRREIVERGKRAVSSVQVRELENIISILNEAVFTDRQHKFYITIDTLDEEWADDRIRYSLIKALIDSIRRFRKIRNIKIIIALRQDLLRKVLHSSADPGFQEEKYESLYLYVRWTRDQLKEMINKRLNLLIRHRYTKQDVEESDLFPAAIDGKAPLDYILDRTFMRPRDAILFVNECIASAEGRAALTASTVKSAEETYSYMRLQSLATEWQVIHPNLKTACQILSGMKDHFELSSITEKLLAERYADVIQEINDIEADPITASLDRLYSKDGNFSSIRNFYIRSLYAVGLIGIKLGPTSSVQWGFDSRVSISPGQLRPSSVIYVHPMFYRALDIRH